MIENNYNHHLFAAIKMQDADQLRFIITQGADVNVKNEEGKTALEFAYENKQTELADILIKQGAHKSPNILPKTPSILEAIDNSNSNLIKELLLKETKRDLVNQTGGTYLMRAVFQNQLISVQTLLEANESIDECDHFGRTALMLAAEDHRIDILKILLQSGANVDTQDNVGWTALTVAADADDLTAVKLLIEAGASSNGAPVTKKTEIDQTTPLKAAAEGGSYEIVTYLFKKGADINHIDTEGASILMKAIENSREQMAMLLIRLGADVHLRDNSGWSCLMEAALMGFKEVVQLILTKNPDISIQSDDGQNVLSTAVESGQSEIIKILIEYNPQFDINEKFGEGWTLLMIAAQNGYLSETQYLLKKGANPLLTDNKGWTALNHAEAEGHSRAINLLKESN